MSNMDLFSPFVGIKNEAKDIVYPDTVKEAGSTPVPTPVETDLAALTEQVTTNKSDITGLKGRMTTAEGKVTTIEGDLNTETTGLKAKVSTIEGDLNTETTGLKDRVTALEEASSTPVESPSV